MEKKRVANGVYWVEMPESDLRILCGCPADAVKFLMKKDFITRTTRGGVSFETGPNAILLSDTQIQKGCFANLSEFPLLQMLYRQGMILPGHPNNTGRRPLLIGLADQVKAQSEYVFRGNYGLSSVEEIAACGIPLQAARDMYRIKEWFAFGRIRPTEELIDLKIVDASVVPLAPGAFVHRKGFNRYEFLAGSESLEVDLTLGPGEEFESPYAPASSEITRERFSVIHIGEGDGWDIERPCMGSIVCFQGLLYLVDAGPNITSSLAALGISMGEIEGIFHTHAHDDHFAGLTSLVASDRKLKYFAVPYVRSTAQKKLSALMRFDEEKFSQYFEIHDLVADRWNDVGGLEVRPLYSPHPLETTVFFFRAREGDRAKTYAHFADIPSFAVLGKLVQGRDGVPALSEASRAAFTEELLQPVDVKKIDVGGGLIHGSEEDFASDASAKLILSHGYAALHGTPRGTGKIASFGDVDTLFSGLSTDFYTRRAFLYLASLFPDAPAADIEALSRCPISLFRAGSIIQTAGSLDEDLHLIISGVAELADTQSASRRQLAAGALLGGARAFLGEPSRESYRAASGMTVLSIPAVIYREFIDRSGLADGVRARAGFAQIHSQRWDRVAARTADR